MQLPNVAVALACSPRLKIENSTRLFSKDKHLLQVQVPGTLSRKTASLRAATRVTWARTRQRFAAMPVMRGQDSRRETVE